ncbi:MAG: tRNA dihydrouridine synthase DusB [Armatimonadetes bacterium]|nr:tRNA dihydrouridine synthase DusB [Candidatus Hippobium faecium]
MTEIPVLKIGKFTFDSPLVLAPMAGLTNHAYRLMCKKQGGCGLVYSEMFSAYAIKFRDPKTCSMLDWTEEEHPVSVQLFGGDGETCAIGAGFLESNYADIIDINFGCPVPKVAKSGSGASILKDLSKAKEIISSVRREVSCPLTVKTRLGWWTDKPTVFDFVKICEDCGVDAIAVHGRYAEQKYSGSADWDMIRQVREITELPLIANGDVVDGITAEKIIRETGCNGVMIGRGSHGRPWVFNHILHYLKTGEVLPEPSFRERIELAREHNAILRQFHGDSRASKEMRGVVAMYIRGFDFSAKIRNLVMQSKSTYEIEEILDNVLSEII